MTTLPALIVTESTSLFDYSALDHAVAAEARATADRIRERIESSYLDTGRDLLGIKVKLGHGYFSKWLHAEFGMTERTAQNFISAAKYANDKPETVSHLPATAVYKLAAASTPVSFRDEVEQRVAKGERPSTREIEHGIAEAKAAEVTEAAKARKLKVKSPATIKAMEKREKDKEVCERQEREETERLLAERQKAAREAIALLRKRLGSDLLRFSHLCRRAKGVFGPALAELVNKRKPIVAEDDRDLSEEVGAEAGHGFTEETMAEDAHDPTEKVVDDADHGFVEEIVDEVDHGFFEEVVADADHGFVEEIVNEVHYGLIDEVVADADHGFVEEVVDEVDEVDDGSNEVVVAMMVVEESSYDPAKLTELDLRDAA